MRCRRKPARWPRISAKDLDGPEAFIFVEVEGGTYVMDGDADRDRCIITDRQEHVRLRAKVACSLAPGAW